LLGRLEERGVARPPVPQRCRRHRLGRFGKMISRQTRFGAID
jgi:hypothetical protein